jgi:ActR/RegA family two-component response regulator
MDPIVSSDGSNTRSVESSAIRESFAGSGPTIRGDRARLTIENDGLHASTIVGDALGHARGLVIIEDFDRIRHMLGHHFTKLGFNVFSASHLCDALEIANAGTSIVGDAPAVVIVDYNLTTENPLRVTSALKIALPATRIMLLGGPATEELRQAVEGNGATDFLPAGYDVPIVDRLLRRINLGAL